jgi:hypothetical protein
VSCDHSVRTVRLRDPVQVTVFIWIRILGICAVHLRWPPPFPIDDLHSTADTDPFSPIGGLHGIVDYPFLLYVASTAQ